MFHTVTQSQRIFGTQILTRNSYNHSVMSAIAMFRQSSKATPDIRVLQCPSRVAKVARRTRANRRVSQNPTD